MANDKSLGERLQSMPKASLYMILFAVASIPLFFPVKLPNKPIAPAVDFYATLMKLPTDKPVLIGTDWTVSTRGESGGQFEALLRILMERKIKFALYSVGDPQAPQVARDVVGRLNQERKAMGKEPYMRFRDWVSLGYYSNAEGELQVIASDVRRAFANRLDFPEGRPPTDVFQSPVLSGIHLVKDFPLLVVVTPSSTNTITIERIGDKVPMMQAVTGVMIPETNVYYASGQLKGMLGGIKGAYDIENLMDTGINFPGPDGKIAFPYEKYKEGVPPIHVGKIIGKGQAYFATLHYTMALLILAVIAGNVGMWLSRKGAK